MASRGCVAMRSTSAMNTGSRLACSTLSAHRLLVVAWLEKLCTCTPDAAGLRALKPQNPLDGDRIEGISLHGLHGARVTKAKHCMAAMAEQEGCNCVATSRNGSELQQAALAAWV